jgi:hypothetical protein
VLAVAAALVASVGATAALAATSYPVSWGKAIEVPGTAALNTSGFAALSSVSCRAVSKCSAGGFYTDGNSLNHAFVVNENSTWGTATQVPGMAALEGSGGGSSVTAVSCGSVGNCVAGGAYGDGTADQAFIAEEKNGVWGAAFEVPGTADLNLGGNAAVKVVSCASAGNCAASGYYYSDADHFQPFVIDETNGVWGTAAPVPGLAALNLSGGAELTSISCKAAGRCAAGGFYSDVNKEAQAFVVDERNGVWGAAIEVPGTAALDAGGGVAAVQSISCGSTAACAAGGYYSDKFGKFHAFLVDERSGTWKSAIEVPGTAALNTGGDAAVDSVSCTGAGTCSAGGYYADSNGHSQGFVVSEKAGSSWVKAIEIPGTAYLFPAGTFEVTSVSCGTAGNCAAAGDYCCDSTGAWEVFVLAQKNGAWLNAKEVPGTAALNVGGDTYVGDAFVNSVSCAKLGKCALAGRYDGPAGYEAFVTAP